MKKMQQKHALLLVFLCLSFSLFSQPAVVDSLWQRANKLEKNSAEYAELLGEIAVRYGEFDRDSLFFYAEKALQISRENGYKKAEVGALYAQSNGFFDFGEYDKALNLAQKSLAIAKELGGKAQIAAGYSLIASISNEKGDISEAIRYYFAALEIFEELGNEYEQAAIYNNLAIGYEKIGLPAEAMKHKFSALKIFRAQNNRYAEAIVLNNISGNYEIMNQNRRAIEFLEKAISINQEIESKFELQRNFRNLAQIYIAMQKYDSAKIYLDRVVRMAKAQKNKGNLAMAYYNLADFYKAQQQYDQALHFFYQSLGIAEQIKMEYGKLYNYKELAEIYFEQGNYAKAQEYAWKSLEVAKKMEMPGMEEQNALLLYRLYKKQGNAQQALRYHELYAELHDSIFSIKKNHAMEEMTVRFDTEQKEQENLQLKKQNEMNRQIIRNRNLLSVVTGIGLLLTLAFLVVILRARKKLHNANENLKEKNQEINTQKEEIQAQAEELSVTNEKLKEMHAFKESMTSMIVHDLKNPLNNILNLPESLAPTQKLDLMKHSGEQMLQLVLNILEVQKFEEAKIQLENKNFNCCQMLDRVLGQLQFLIDEKQIQLEVGVGKEKALYADFEITERIFLNLLTNALKYTPANGQIRINASPAGQNWLKLCVCNTGDPIPEKQKALIFQRFAQADSQKSGSIRSTGLGLTFCKLAVEEHGGQIEVFSAPGEDTCFCFTLPKGEDTAPEEKLENIAKPQPITLSESERSYLAPFAKQLGSYKIYEFSELRSVLGKADPQQSPQVRRWLETIKKAVISANQKKLSKLIDLVLSDPKNQTV